MLFFFFACLQSIDSLLNAETVKLYSGEQYEVDQYNRLILQYQDKEYASVASLSLLNQVQSFIIAAGMACYVYFYRKNPGET
jgi:ABC-type transport system involved in Fe-S cluster assembly fused permease/ATPase subunit